MTAREGTHEERWPRSKAPVEVDREGAAHDGEQRVGNGGASEAEPTAVRVRGDRGGSARGRGRGRERTAARVRGDRGASARERGQGRTGSERRAGGERAAVAVKLGGEQAAVAVKNEVGRVQRVGLG